MKTQTLKTASTGSMTLGDPDAKLGMDKHGKLTIKIVNIPDNVDGGKLCLLASSTSYLSARTVYDFSELGTGKIIRE